MKLKLLILPLTFVTILSWGVVFVQAQNTEGQIRQQVSTAEQQAQIKAEYQTYLSQYRENEKAYILANQEYTQLQTLASLEKSVQATKTAMQTRNQVLDRFLTLLKLQLIDTNGIVLSNKQTALGNIDASIAELTQFNQTVIDATDKPALTQASLTFEELTPALENDAYTGLSLLSFGRIQTVYDKTSALLTAIEIQVNQDSATTLSAEVQRRGIEELKTQLNTIKSQLDLVSADISSSMMRQEMSDSAYNSLLRNLQPMYADLSRVHTQMEELI